jgi:hypothetical protein
MRMHIGSPVGGVLDQTIQADRVDMPHDGLRNAGWLLTGALCCP